jgi:hypothetical protein
VLRHLAAGLVSEEVVVLCPLAADLVRERCAASVSAGLRLLAVDLVGERWAAAAQRSLEAGPRIRNCWNLRWQPAAGEDGDCFGLVRWEERERHGAVRAC